MARTVHTDLFDRPRNLRLDINSLSDIEEHCAVNIAELFKEQRVGFSVIRALLCFGLKHEDKTMSPARAGMLMQAALERGVTLDQIMEPIGAALKESGLFSDTPAPTEDGNAEDGNQGNASAATA